MSKYHIEKTWVTKAGLTAVAIIVSSGGKPHHRCGYVGVPADSFLTRLNYDNKLLDVSVHGGLTYSSNMDYRGTYPIDSTDWFFGFDCAHCDDGIIEPTEQDCMYGFDKATAKSLDFVTVNCESLAAQLAKILSGDSHD